MKKTLAKIYIMWTVHSVVMSNRWHIDNEFNCKIRPYKSIDRNALRARLRLTYKKLIAILSTIRVILISELFQKSDDLNGITKSDDEINSKFNADEYND